MRRSERLHRTIAKRLGLRWPLLPDIIKRLDTAILSDERDQIMARPPRDWLPTEPPIGVTLQFWTPGSRPARTRTCRLYRG
jgi:hypothetical protein